MRSMKFGVQQIEQRRDNEEGLGERDGDRQRKIERKRRERQTDRQSESLWQEARQSESLWQEVSNSMLAEHWNVIDKYSESE